MSKFKRFYNEQIIGLLKNKGIVASPEQVKTHLKIMNIMPQHRFPILEINDVINLYEEEYE